MIVVGVLIILFQMKTGLKPDDYISALSDQSHIQRQELD